MMQGDIVPGLLEMSIVRKDGTEVPIELTGASTTYRGKRTIVAYIRDITERRLSFEKLRRPLQGTIQAMAATVESRDPYTAGHQRRVTNIACAIAKEMGLSDDWIEGLYMAGMVHDIGKIYIPAEILSKPGSLNEIEFSMIKMHSQAGFDILKNIEFPWPVAQAVLQHHERLDGSGYPSGLLGDEIILEARIITVADVVEAISSHRPYRPAIGIDKALDEISGKRGILYDPKVVDTCLKLIKEKRLELNYDHIRVGSLTE